MDRLTAIKIKYEDGTYSDEIPIYVTAENVEYNDEYSLIETLGYIDVKKDGTIQEQINKITSISARIPTLENRIANIQGGAPTVVGSVSAMTDTDQIYVLTTDGAWYYYDGSAWVAGGEYGAGAGATDTTLTQAGMPADAKAVGDRLVKFNSAKNGLVPASGVKSDKKYYLAGNGKFEKIPFDSVACQNLITILQSCVYDKDVSVNITNLAEALGINSGGDGGDDMTFQFGQSIMKGSTSRQLTGLGSFQMTEIRLVVALHSDFQQGVFCAVSVPAASNPYLGIGSTGDFYYSNQGSYPGNFSATPANLVDFVGNEPKEVKIQYLNPSGFTNRAHIGSLKFFFNAYNPSCGFTLYRISGYDGATKLFSLESTGTNGELYDTMTGTTYTFDNTSGMEIVEVEEE